VLIRKRLRMQWRKCMTSRQRRLTPWSGEHICSDCSMQINCPIAYLNVHYCLGLYISEIICIPV
jgi:hypothetical protein